MTDFKVFRDPLLIIERHLDTFSHVNNATYLEILEEARWAFLTEQGFDLKTIHEHSVGPIVLECNIQFLKELRCLMRKKLALCGKIFLMKRMNYLVMPN